MANLLYKNYNTGCYVGFSGDDATNFYYGRGTQYACYFADLQPNTTYSIQCVDTSSRFRYALSTQDLKYKTSTSSAQVDTPFTQAAKIDATTASTFTTGGSDIHLTVYFTSDSEYTTRVMLNEGSTIQPYEAPTIPYGWSIQGNQLTNSEFIDMPATPFVGDSPLSMWRIQDGILQTGLSIPCEALGAFANATQLKRVEIPRSVKSIGAEAFRNTLLTSVTIASDCTYSSTSFPEGCVINFYPD